MGIMLEEKSTNHNVIVRLLSEQPITYSAAVFALAKSIDSDEIDAHDLLILGYDFNDSNTGKTARPKLSESQKREAATKIGAFLSRSPGALGDLYAQFGWKGVYMGGAVGILVLVLLQKFLVRTLTGNW